MFLKATEIKIQDNFQKFIESFSGAGAEIGQEIKKESPDIGLLLKYLYINMPFSDIANYSYQIFREFASHAAYLRKNQPWQGKDYIPDHIFLDYVVFHRVNNEGISSCRQFFYKKLKNRVKKKTMEEAIIETNYWCAEEATYQSTDDRTISAKAVYQSGIGRCGEESVFTVNALRSLGIPARQVYTTRWAHCDDNHAWVEAWASGKWRFLGACEPEEILDRGWFSNASARAMVIYSRIYGLQDIDGDIIKQEDMTLEINRLSNYAQTIDLEILVLNSKGEALENAKLSFSLLNYSELVPIAQLKTDVNGYVRLKTGKGSLFISAWKEEEFLEIVIDAGKTSKITIKLDKKVKYDSWIDFNMLAPIDKPVFSKKLSPQQIKDGEVKKELSQKKRIKKMEGFFHKEANHPLTRAMGNFKEIEKFMDAKSQYPDLKPLLLGQLSLKDFRDCETDLLLDHLNEAGKWQKTVEEDIFEAYILSPRIDNEQQSAYRKKINDFFNQDEIRAFRQKPNRIWDWIERELTSMDGKEYLQLLTTPAACLRYKICSEMSKKILFVAIARSLGIPARLNPINKAMQYYSNGRFYNVRKIQDQKGEGIIKIRSLDENNWIYMSNWTIAKKIEENNSWQRLEVGEGYQGEVDLELAEGIYRIITSNRLPNGNQFASYIDIELKEGQTRQVDLKLRKAKLGDMLEEIDIDDFELQREDGYFVRAKEILERGPGLFIWLEVDNEPTEHILNEIYERKDEFASLSNQINLIISSPKDQGKPSLTKLKEEIKNINIYLDSSKKNINYLARRMYGDPDKLPLILILNQEMKGIYSSSGYNVGTGDMILRIMTSNIVRR